MTNEELRTLLKEAEEGSIVELGAPEVRAVVEELLAARAIISDYEARFDKIVKSTVNIANWHGANIRAKNEVKNRDNHIQAMAKGAQDDQRAANILNKVLGRKK